MVVQWRPSNVKSDVSIAVARVARTASEAWRVEVGRVATRARRRQTASQRAMRWDARVGCAIKPPGERGAGERMREGCTLADSLDGRRSRCSWYWPADYSAECRSLQDEGGRSGGQTERESQDEQTEQDDRQAGREGGWDGDGMGI